MSVFKRLSATMVSHVDKLVSEIENHDAIIETAIRDHQKALARAKVRFNRMQADGRRLRRRLEDLEAAERQWSERARKNADADQNVALQCLKKRRECRQQITGLQNTLAEHGNAEERLRRDIGAVEAQHREITQQRNLMRTRESAADAMRTFRAIQSGCGINIDDTFERWETRVVEAELLNGDIQPIDPLEQQFADDEELEDLRAELDALTREQRS